MYNFKIYKSSRPKCQQQRGVSLIELMVGVAIGLVVVGAALATLLLSRTTSGTVTDASQLQQQASYALFILGDRISSTGSLRFDTVAAGSIHYVFDSASAPYAGAAGQGAKISGTTGANHDTLITSMQHQASGENIDCLGAPLTAVTALRNDATFYVDGKALLCRPNHGDLAANLTPQQIITNVEEFKVRYGVRVGAANMQYFTATEIQAQLNPVVTWNKVALVEVCLHLKGAESNQPVITGATYTNCNGGSQNRDNYLRQIITRSFYTANSGV